MQTGLILAVPGLRDAVETWRTAALPGASLDVPPHLTVLYPWVEREPTEEDRRRVREATHHLRRFDLTFRDVGTFPGFVWLRPDPTETVVTVHRAVAGAFAEFPPYAGEHPDFVPHLTVARCEAADTPAFAALASAALAGAWAPRLGCFEVQGIDVAMRRGEAEPFASHRVVTFGAESGSKLRPA